MPLHLPEWRRPRQLGVKEKGAYANLLQPELDTEPERRDSTTLPDLSPVQTRRTEIPVPVVRPGSGRGQHKSKSSSNAGKTVSFSPSDDAVEPVQVDGGVSQQQEQQSLLSASDDRIHDSLPSKPVKRGFSMDFSLLSPSSSSHHHAATARAALAKLSPNQHGNAKARPAKAEVTKESKHALSPAARLAQSRSKGAGGKAVRQAEAVLTLISGATPPSAQQDTGNGGGGGVQLSSKQLRELKSALGKPTEANRIIDELKKLPSPPIQAPVATTSLALTGSAAAPAHPAAKGVCLDCPDAEVLPKHEHASALASAPSPASSPSKGKPPPPPLPRRPSASASDVKAEDATSALLNGKFGVLSEANGLPTPGKILGQIATSSGAFDALAGVTGRLIDSSGAHDGALKPPNDRLSVLVYWWGYEVILPPPTIAYLASVNSVAGTAFTFLQALAAGGGVPELVPFIRYLSMYIDMEWKAIQQQNKGRGVVLAATWIVPVAVVPRPLAFA